MSEGRTYHPGELSPDGQYYWDGAEWKPSLSPDRAHRWNGVAWVPVTAVSPVIVTKQGGKAKWIIGGVVAVVVLGIIGSAASASNGGKTASVSATPKPAANAANAATATPNAATPKPTPTPIDPAQYKASCQSIPYVQLKKDPDSMHGTHITYVGQITQYDSNTGLSHMRVYVTDEGYGFWTDDILVDVPTNLTQNSFVEKDKIQIWGEVIGAYTYTTQMNGQRTIPEISAKYIEKVA